MGKNEFDKELGTYLSRRKKAEMPDIIGWLKGFIPKPAPPPVNVSMPAEIETYEEKQTKKPEIKKEIVEEPVSKNVWTFLMEKLRSISLPKKPQVNEEEQETKIRDIVAKEMIYKDLREISKVALIAIKKLPEEDMKEFKESAEFESLKNILKKHDLIK